MLLINYIDVSHLTTDLGSQRQLDVSLVKKNTRAK